jgi:hypothetical protein
MFKAVAEGASAPSGLFEPQTGVYRKSRTAEHAALRVVEWRIVRYF